jgi:hypothetical protein
MLAEDPFVDGGVTAIPASPRFTYVDRIAIGGGAGNEYAVHKLVRRADEREVVRSTTNIEDYEPGWLSFLGVGESRNGSYSMTVSRGQSLVNVDESTESAAFTLYSPVTNGRFEVDAYYDNLYGTFALRPKTIVGNPVPPGHGGRFD